jgi:hypothetical protein
MPFLVFVMQRPELGWASDHAGFRVVSATTRRLRGWPDGATVTRAAINTGEARTLAEQRYKAGNGQGDDTRLNVSSAKQAKAATCPSSFLKRSTVQFLFWSANLRK